MKIKWLGHAAFLFTSEKGIRMIIDPYESGGFGGAVGYGPIRETADIVVTSHGHSDHNYLGDIQGKPQVIKGPGAHRVGEIEIKGVLAYHDTSLGEERGKIIMNVLTVDGVRICHVGDLGHQPTDQQLADLGPVDVLLVAVGGYYTIDAAEATRLVERLAPRMVIPMHFRTDKCTFPISGVEDFLKGKGAVRRPGASEIEISRDTLPAKTEIVVLEHAL